MLLLKDSALIDTGEEEGIDRNHLRVARRGRAVQLTLERGGRDVPLRDWAAELLDGMQPVCEWLDAGLSARPYTQALNDQLGKLQEPELTPSARLLSELEQSEESFAELALRVSREHREKLSAQVRSEQRTGSNSPSRSRNRCRRSLVSSRASGAASTSISQAI